MRGAKYLILVITALLLLNDLRPPLASALVGYLEVKKVKAQIQNWPAAKDLFTGYKAGLRALGQCIKGKQYKELLSELRKSQDESIQRNLAILDERPNLEDQTQIERAVTANNAIHQAITSKKEFVRSNFPKIIVNHDMEHRDCGEYVNEASEKWPSLVFRLQRIHQEMTLLTEEMVAESSKEAAKDNDAYGKPVTISFYFIFELTDESKAAWQKKEGAKIPKGGTLSLLLDVSGVGAIYNTPFEAVNDVGNAYYPDGEEGRTNCLEEAGEAGSKLRPTAYKDCRVTTAGIVNPEANEEYARNFANFFFPPKDGQSFIDTDEERESLARQGDSEKPHLALAGANNSQLLELFAGKAYAAIPVLVILFVATLIYEAISYFFDTPILLDLIVDGIALLTGFGLAKSLVKAGKYTKVLGLLFPASTLGKRILAISVGLSWLVWRWPKIFGEKCGIGIGEIFGGSFDEVFRKLLWCIFTAIFAPIIRWAAGFVEDAAGLSYRPSSSRSKSSFWKKHNHLATTAPP